MNSMLNGNEDGSSDQTEVLISARQLLRVMTVVQAQSWMLDMRDVT